MRVVYLTLLLVLLLKISFIQNKNTRTEGNQGKADKIPANINSVGQKVNKNSVVSKFPLTINTCDQIAIFKAKYITDMNDYKLRETAWFSISAYTINIYKDKDANQLIHSVEIGNLKQHPEHLKGAQGCVRIDGGSASADITICFGDKSTAANVLNVISTFYRCRRGDNLQPIPKKLLRELVQTCTKGAGALKWGKTVSAAKAVTGARAGNKWDADRMKYYHPVGIKVPGTS
jgi:hypothetical protein